MAKVKALINRFPRLTWFIIGLVVAIPICSTSFYYADKTIKEYQSINRLVIEEYKSKTETQSAKIEKLSTENSKLKKKSSTYKIVRADGTVEERTESSMESEKQLTEAVKEEYYKKLAEETKKIHNEYAEKLQKSTTERKKLNIEAGVTQELDYYTHGSYNIYGGMSLGGGVLFKSQTYMLGVGINL